MKGFSFVKTSNVVIPFKLQEKAIKFLKQRYCEFLSSTESETNVDSNQTVIASIQDHQQHNYKKFLQKNSTVKKNSEKKDKTIFF